MSLKQYTVETQLLWNTGRKSNICDLTINSGRL